MKGTLVLLGSGLLAATLAIAQDAPAASNQDQDNTASQTQSNQTTHSYQTSNNVIRGCLSGSAGNYTITDQNGTQYSVAGSDNQLQASVGHEVELTARQDQTNQSSAQGGQTTASTTNTVQVTNLRDIASTCSSGHSMGTPPTGDQSKPQATPDAAEPPQSRPQTIAMLQQQESTPGSPAPQQTTPPVTSQTPATPGASTSSTQQNAQQGAATSSTTTSTTSTTTTNSPQTGTTPTTDQGATSSTPNANTPGANATPSSNTTGSDTQQPQANTTTNNDPNRPLYERQATDIPWAHSGSNNGANNSNSGANNPSEQNPPH
jgi:hypothetical protein